MDEDCAAGANRLPDETVSAREVLAEVFPRDVHHVDHFVLQIAGKARVQACKDLEDVCDTLHLFRCEIYSHAALARTSCLPL